MPSLFATLQALVATQQATIPDPRAPILELRATDTQLQERIRDLESRAGQHVGNSSPPPSSDRPGRQASAIPAHWPGTMNGPWGRRVATACAMIGETSVKGRMHQ